MTTTILLQGVSPTADYIAKISQAKRQYFATTAAFSKQPAINELVNVWTECRKSNWDGYNALPVEAETLSYTYAFIQSLPLGFPLPSVGAEPDGHLTLDWYRHPHWTISISISPKGVLYYAALLGNSDPRGSEPFLGEIPRRLLNLIQEVALARS